MTPMKNTCLCFLFILLLRHNICRWHLNSPRAISLVIAVYYRSHRMNENVLKITSTFAVQVFVKKTQIRSLKIRCGQMTN